MIEGKKCMERRIDRSSNAILSEGRKRIVTDHFVFVLFAAVEIFELIETIEIEHGESSVGDGAEISTTAFHRQDANRAAGEWIWKVHLGAGVAAAEVRNAQIGS